MEKEKGKRKKEKGKRKKEKEKRLKKKKKQKKKKPGLEREMHGFPFGSCGRKGRSRTITLTFVVFSWKKKY